MQLLQLLVLDTMGYGKLDLKLHKWGLRCMIKHVKIIYTMKKGLMIDYLGANLVVPTYILVASF